MDATETDRIERDIAETRGAIDRDLHALSARAVTLREDAREQVTTWLPIAAIGAGVIGAIAFWPRRRQVERRYAWIACV